MALQPPVHPPEKRPGPLVQSRSSSPLARIHGRQDVLTNLQAEANLYACCPITSVILKGPTNLFWSFAGIPFQP